MATTRMHVIDCSSLRSGTSNGKEWTLYKITATRPDGSPIYEELKSFAKLEGEVEVEVEKQDNEKYGVSYLLKPAGSKSAGARLGPKVDELRERVDWLERALKELERQVLELKGQRVYGQPPPAPAGGYTPPPSYAPATPPADERSINDDDDPPF